MPGNTSKPLSWRQKYIWTCFHRPAEPMGETRLRPVPIGDEYGNRSARDGEDRGSVEQRGPGHGSGSFCSAANGRQ
ncbi:hypothetical protein MLD38_020621 [Melastoma candidum]|uniref:Uncharacterized protein n=1 Tax=Melastoma candidum TaxID=119954 RepID=A0ACB9QDU7_9MYRT|nr:hypothetical protein MLD38_020621 [Melastoma candidum]